VNSTNWNQSCEFTCRKKSNALLEFGDLRENSEYKAALDRQNMVKARIVELRQRISEIASIDPSKVPRDKASYGSTLVLYDAEKDEEVNLQTGYTGRERSRAGFDLDDLAGRQKFDG
jgi:transcription elongation GreA/GreB family factor